MERAERMILLGVAFLGSAFVVPVLWVMLVLISVTAIARFVKVWNEASGKDVAIRRRVVAWREGRVDSRWRSWREGSAVPRGVAQPEDGCPRRSLAGPTPGNAEQPFRPYTAGPAARCRNPHWRRFDGPVRRTADGAGARITDGRARRARAAFLSLRPA